MDTNNNMEFFITVMPSSRKADYYLGCSEGSVYIDFNNHDNKHVRLRRISFDGYGCCDLEDKAIPMDEADSYAFKEMFKNDLLDQSRLELIIKKTLSINRELIWDDALKEYFL
jgi:hypothetical protein